MLRNQTQAHSQWLSSAARPVYHSGACLRWDAAREIANCAKQRRRVADYVLKFGCEALTFGKLLGRLWHKVQFGPLRVGILERFLDTCWLSSSPNFSPLQNFWKSIFKPATTISFKEEVRVNFFFKVLFSILNFKSRLFRVLYGWKSGFWNKPIFDRGLLRLTPWKYFPGMCTIYFQENNVILISKNQIIFLILLCHIQNLKNFSHKPPWVQFVEVEPFDFTKNYDT